MSDQQKGLMLPQMAQMARGAMIPQAPIVLPQMVAIAPVNVPETLARRAFCQYWRYRERNVPTDRGALHLQMWAELSSEDRGCWASIVHALGMDVVAVRTELVTAHNVELARRAELLQSARADTVRASKLLETQTENASVILRDRLAHLCDRLSIPGAVTYVEAVDFLEHLQAAQTQKQFATGKRLVATEKKLTAARKSLALHEAQLSAYEKKASTAQKKATTPKPASRKKTPAK
jgi:hypothetical protein